MKQIRLCAFFLIIALLLTACQAAPPNELPAEELRAVWFSCYDYAPAAGKTETEYRAVTDEIFSALRRNGFNAAFVHLRAFSDAFYPSDLFPASAYLAGTRGGSLPFDPFAVLLESAAANGIAVHGWINPFRILSVPDPAQLCAGEPAQTLLEAGDPDGRICMLENGIYYNPACPENHALILAGVKEILEHYAVAGIHIDDYFYPATDAALDQKQYAEYLAAGGQLPLLDWRRENVNAFVAALYSTVKAANPAATVSISPAGNLEENYESLCADCKLWLSAPGYADLILPQLYYGFAHETADFTSALATWAALPRDQSVRLACGLGFYKLGAADPYAGSGAEEWLHADDLPARQLQAVRANGAYCGFSVFSYRDLLRTDCSEAVARFLRLL